MLSGGHGCSRIEESLWVSSAAPRLRGCSGSWFTTSPCKVRYYQMLEHGVFNGALFCGGMLYGPTPHGFDNQRVRRPGDAGGRSGGVFPFRRSSSLGLPMLNRG